MDPKEQFLPFFLWDGDENPTTLIENILPLASKFSNAPEKKLKEMISTEVLTVVKRKYANFEFETTFDENGIFHLKRDNYDCLPTLSTGDRIRSLAVSSGFINIYKMSVAAHPGQSIFPSRYFAQNFSHRLPQGYPTG